MSLLDQGVGASELVPRQREETPRRFISAHYVSDLRTLVTHANCDAATAAGYENLIALGEQHPDDELTFILLAQLWDTLTHVEGADPLRGWPHFENTATNLRAGSITALTAYEDGRFADARFVLRALGEEAIAPYLADVRAYLGGPDVPLHPSDIPLE